jgi:hypothetical protein
MTETLQVKRCTRCGRTKPLGEFHYHSQTRDNRQSQCIECKQNRYLSGYYKVDDVAAMDRVEKFCKNQLDPSELAMDEVLGNFIRDDDGIPVLSKDLPDRFIPKFKKELNRRLSLKVSQLAPRALDIIFEIANSDLAEPSDRLKAATFLLERVIGKTPETLLLGQADQPYQEIITKIEGGRREEYRALKSGNGNGTVIEAEIVDDKIEDNRKVTDSSVSSREGSNDSSVREQSTTSDAATNIEERKKELKKARDRIKKAKQQRLVAKLTGAKSVSQIPWIACFNPIEDVNDLVALVREGYEGRSAWRVTFHAPVC